MHHDNLSIIIKSDRFMKNYMLCLFIKWLFQRHCNVKSNIQTDILKSIFLIYNS